jgi:hypothetical protein
VQRGDGGLDLVGPGVAQAQRALELVAALGQARDIPASAVLIGQRDVVAGRVGAGGAARVVDEHERQQARGLGVVGHELDEQAAEPDRLGAQLLAHEPIAGRRGVALVEDEVDDGEHRGQAIGQVGVLGHAVRDVCRCDLALGPHEALGHRRLGDEEAARDLGRRQAAERAQRQRDARLHGERRVTAGEDQAQAVVGDGALLRAPDVVLVAVELHEPVEDGQAVLQGALAAQAIDCLAPGGRRDPGSGVVRLAVARPRGQRDGEGVLERVLGELEVTAEMADQRRQDAPGLLAERSLDARGHLTGTS